MTHETRWLLVAVVLVLASLWAREQLVGLLILLLAAGALRWSNDAGLSTGARDRATSPGAPRSETGRSHGLPRVAEPSDSARLVSSRASRRPTSEPSAARDRAG